MFQAQVIGVRVILLGTVELAKTDCHHLEESAFDLTGEICVPLHTANQHDAV